MKTTVFTKYHIAAGAKMAEFAGYNMPIEFTGINDEHMAVRNGAGVFDVSHMGEIWVKGPRALDLLQRITTNDVSKLFDGKVQYTCMPNGRGGIVDDILVYRVDAETYMLCVNAANIDKDWKHICAEGKAFGMEAGHGRELYNASDEICQLAVQGPLAMKIVQKMCAEPVEGMEYYTFKKMPVAGCDAILSITGYTGSGGCEIYVANEDGDKLWKALWEAGEEFGLKNIGLGARDTLRLEKGFCLYGNDIDDVDRMVVKLQSDINQDIAAQAPLAGLDTNLSVIINNDQNTTLARWVGATPNGRKAGTPFANANNPEPGADKNGVTAMINSLLKMPQDNNAGTVQNFRFSKELFQASREKVLELIQNYFDRGGAQAMISVVGREDLKNALERPEDYRDLIVRVGGFSARFVDLHKDVQVEIYNRTTY